MAAHVDNDCDRIRRGLAFAAQLIFAMSLLSRPSAAIELEQSGPPRPVPAASAEAARQAYLSILADGWKTTSDEAAQLESDVMKNPHNIAARTRLISYYYQQMIADRRARHILWLIEEHPEAEIFRVASDVAGLSHTWHGLNSASDEDRARVLWLRAAERFPNNSNVLANAAQALSAGDSLRLLARARYIEPGNRDWTVHLAEMYARSIRDVFYERDGAVEPRLFVGPVKYRNMWPMRLPSAPLQLAEKMMKDLETSAYAALVGETGEMLVEEVAVIIERGQPKTSEMTHSADVGRRLLERAHSLDPANPRRKR
jgi:hypothetical protein